MSQDICTACGGPVSGDERGLCLKCLGRNVTAFYCLPCLADQLGTSRESLEARIVAFRKMGCMLFSVWEEEKP